MFQRTLKSEPEKKNTIEQKVAMGSETKCRRPAEHLKWPHSLFGNGMKIVCHLFWIMCAATPGVQDASAIHRWLSKDEELFCKML